MADKPVIKEKKSSLIIWLIAILVLLLSSILIYKTSQVNEELEEKQRELTEYNNAIQAAHEKTREMEDEIKYRSTDDYIEEAARDIGLIDPNETIIKPEE
ncbi:MAG: septum formation initiator family protein [Lachnospiraceae bacterium]|nr:septum formation initiator family protein [Lachnospiraceae bacterium]